jgi:uncharacterized protein
MVQVELSRIIIDEKRQDQVIVLKEKDGERQIPIVIGFMEASSIKIKVSGVDVPRPMTHDLLVNVMKVLGGHLQRVVIDKLVNNTFHAKLEIASKDGVSKTIDSRPSDSIALAVRLKAPIFVAEEVLQKSSLSQP